MAPLSEFPLAIGYVRGLLGGADRQTAEAVVGEIDQALPIGWHDDEAITAVLNESDTTEGRALLAELWGEDLDRRLGAIAERTGAGVDDVAAVAHRLVLLITVDSDLADTAPPPADDVGEPSEADSGSEAEAEGRRGGRRGLRRLLRGRPD